MATKEVPAEVTATAITLNVVTGAVSIKAKGESAKKTDSYNLMDISEESRLKILQSCADGLNHNGYVTTAEELNEDIVAYKEKQNEIA